MKNVLCTVTILGIIGISLSGCQTMTSSFNAVSDTMYVAQLPKMSSTKLQIVTDWGSLFSATPNSTTYRSSSKSGSSGILAWNGSSKGKKLIIQPFTDAEKVLVYDNDLNMTKPTDDEQRLYSLGTGSSSNYTVTERYITPNQPLAVKYRANNSFGGCNVKGSFIPEANTDYRLTGVFGQKCVMMLEKFVIDSNGQTVLKSIKFDD